MTETYAKEIDLIGSEVAPHIEHNGSSVTYQRLTVASHSSAGFSINIVVPNMNVFVNRSIKYTIPLQATFTGTNVATTVPLMSDVATPFCIRSMADMRIFQTMAVTINGVTLPASAINDLYIEPLLHYDPMYRKEHPLSYPDPSANYADVAGSNISPMSPYGTSINAIGGNTRGNYPYTVISSTATSLVVAFNLVGWIYVPNLLGLDKSDERGLIGVKTIDLNINYNLDPKYVISILPTLVGTTTATLTSIVCVDNGAPTLLLKYISPPQEMLPTQPVSYRFQRMERFPQALGAVANAGTTFTIVSNTIQLPTIPRYVYAYVRESDTNKTASTTDTFATVADSNGISINFNNQSALCSSATQLELYNICRTMGLMDTWHQFTGLSIKSSPGGIQVPMPTIGAPICLKFGKHISLGDPNLSIGQSGSFNFQLAFTGKALINMTNPTLYVILAYDQDFILTPQGEVHIQNVVSPNEFNGSGGLVSGGLVSGGARLQRVRDTENGQFNGGFSFGDFLGKANDWLKDTKIISTIAKAIPATSAIAPAISSFGYGASEGGATLTKAEMKAMIKSL